MLVSYVSHRWRSTSSSSWEISLKNCSISVDDEHFRQAIFLYSDYSLALLRALTQLKYMATIKETWLTVWLPGLIFPGIDFIEYVLTLLSGIIDKTCIMVYWLLFIQLSHCINFFFKCCKRNGMYWFGQVAVAKRSVSWHWVQYIKDLLIWLGVRWLFDDSCALCTGRTLKLKLILAQGFY